ncbi:hypothetical protein HanXRQr2_Chr11g0506881 [Helianthus annuus]|uniref:Uncharacterized protein n=1 Tax=Helianthus annuus TaxID=4232 RepID=A0A9K3HSA3_HELAN|nr:hypothetical protein HanXRQr2_Chr11g0506881 [Helianthus annuus]KAJ0876442.1 hypothetical protein HanPSC8_Chr11g0488511 [Helianthus annuus]
MELRCTARVLSCERLFRSDGRDPVRDFEGRFIAVTRLELSQEDGEVEEVEVAVTVTDVVKGHFGGGGGGEGGECVCVSLCVWIVVVAE